MRKIILQHATIEQKEILDASKPFNEAHAAKTGFEYSVSDMSRRCPNKALNYEKIGYLVEMLPKFEDGSLVVWLDADTICLKDESFEKALPQGAKANESLIGMVRMLHGVNCKEPHQWWNIGVTVMKNCALVRDFFNRVHKRNEQNDEWSAMAELKEHGWTIGDGIPLSSIHYKWNTWKNNAHMGHEPNVVSWHGVHSSKKLAAMKEFITKVRG